MGHRQETSAHKWSPRELWTPVMTLLIGLMIGKLLLFDVLWCLSTSWNGLLDVRLYVHAILLSFILSIPIGMFRRKWLQLAILLVMDVWCMYILFQGGAGSTDLPVIGWLLTDGLPDMKTGSIHTFQWYHLSLPATTLLSLMVCLKNKGRTTIPMAGKMQYCGYLLAWSLITYLLA